MRTLVPVTVVILVTILMVDAGARVDTSQLATPMSILRRSTFRYAASLQVRRQPQSRKTSRAPKYPLTLNL